MCGISPANRNHVENHLIHQNNQVLHSSSTITSSLIWEETTRKESPVPSKVQINQSMPKEYLIGKPKPSFSGQFSQNTLQEQGHSGMCIIEYDKSKMGQTNNKTNSEAIDKSCRGIKISAKVFLNKLSYVDIST